MRWRSATRWRRSIRSPNVYYCCATNRALPCLVGNCGRIPITFRRGLIWSTTSYSYKSCINYNIFFRYFYKIILSYPYWTWTEIINLLPIWLPLLFGVATVSDDNARRRARTANKWSLRWTIRSTESSRSKFSSFSWCNEDRSDATEMKI